MKTSTIRLAGTNNCGKSAGNVPYVKKDRSVVLLLEQEDVEMDQATVISTVTRTISQLTKEDLYELHSVRREVKTTKVKGKIIQTIRPNGTLENITSYAKLSFCGDEDQQNAFVQIVSAFVVKLHEKVICHNNIRKRYRNGINQLDFSKPIYVWVWQGATDHLATLTDESVLFHLKQSNQADNGDDNISLLQLGIDRSIMVSIKWTSTDEPGFVELSTLRLSEASTETKTHRSTYLRELKAISNNQKQFICFLSGAGGTGKSKVIHTMKHYCKILCKELGVVYNNKTIVVTALTGAAAVTINGQTMHRACDIFGKPGKDDEWEDTIMVVVDEISFITINHFEQMNTNLNAKCDVGPSYLFGNLQMVFAGDFCQLSPPSNGSKPLFMYKDLSLWWNGVNTFLELRTNHRFKNDKNWGHLLEQYRLKGPTTRNLDKIHTRILCKENGLSEDDLPDDICYATRTNIDRCAINDAIFHKLLAETHSRDYSITPPDFTLCIRVSSMKIRKHGTKQTYIDMTQVVKNIVHSTCGDPHVKGGQRGTQMFDPMLKLYVGCPVMITENIDVENCIANGSMCSFKGIELKKGLGPHHLGYINIDGFYVRCVDAENVQHIVLELQENRKLGIPPKIIKLKTKRTTATAKIPIPAFQSTITHQTKRHNVKISLTQFPLNISNARTGHKLQGRDLDNVFIYSMDYTGNWIYVVLSRVKPLEGLFLMTKIVHSKTKGMSKECTAFYNYFRNNKTPKKK